MELNIKHEPSVDYELILPALTEVKIKNNNPFGIKPCSVNLENFDAEWKHKSKIFAIYLSCRYCKWISWSEESFKAHEKACQRKQKNVCGFCEKKFDSKNRFMAHTRAKPIECQLCQVEFKCRTLWSKHKEEHHQQGFKCDRCSFVGKTKDSFDQHYSQHTKKFSCETCDGRFRCKYELKLHQMRRRHGVFENVDSNQGALYQDKRLECDLCGKKFTTKRKMTRHLQSHAEGKCKFCGEMIAQSRMATHVNQEHVKSERSLSCKDCGKRFLKRSEYSRHINPKRPAKCRSCQIDFKCRILWQKHRKEQHAESGFKCNQCSFVGKAKDNLRKHLMVHTKQFSCDSCQMKFAFKFRLEDHQKNQKHGVFATVKVEALQCDKCEKSFQTKSSLRCHKSTHKSKNFVCDLCGKTLKSKQSLIAHFRTHIFEKCEICKLSLTKTQMPNHLVRRHNKVDSSCRCKDCGTLFAKQASARHVNSQRKKCVPCKIEFKCCGLMSQHNRKMHRSK